MRVLALYLPQYHAINENDQWWGKGYTEWTAVRKARPLYEGHRQPRIPLSGSYYDLSEETASAIKEQAALAKKYGIYGFCIYHYWFKGRKLLEKPMELLLRHPEIDLNYCICWANESWTRTWYGLKNEVLISQEYGEERDWENHFSYLLQFFKDRRYVKRNNRPLINIYRSTEIKKLKEMLHCWRKLARRNGFDDLCVIVSNSAAIPEMRSELIDGYYNFEPGYSTGHHRTAVETAEYKSRVLVKTLANRILRTKRLERTVDIRQTYRKICENSTIRTLNGKPLSPGLFPGWDNTPRRGYRGMVYLNYTPTLFYNTLKCLSTNIDRDSYVYINAWNEWGEGCYLEPDQEYEYGYLEAIRKATEND